MRLESMTWQRVKRAKLANSIALLPLGSFEQHGPHLPLTTDTDIVTGIARELERRRPKEVLLLPTLWLGHSTHHLAFPGTLSVHQMPYIHMLEELCASIANIGTQKVLLLNGHGGNDVPARAALRELKSVFPEMQLVFASYWSLSAKTIKDVRESALGGIGHACELETSLMLHLHPDRVNMKLARRDGPEHSDPLRRVDMQHARPAYYVQEFDEMSDTGTIGHPDLATPDKGRRFFEGIVSETAAFLDAMATW